MPKAIGLDVPLCTYMGNECFGQKFANVTYKLGFCNCLPSCSEVTYKVGIETVRKFTASEIEEMCSSSRNPHPQYIDNTESKHLIDIIKMMNVTEEDYLFSKKSCLDYVANGFSRITVKVVGSSYLRRSQSIAMSFSDKLGVIGGTIGLFSGFSFIAIFELGYWIIITLIKYFKSSVEPEEEDPVQKLREEMKKENDALKLRLAKHDEILMKKENPPAPEEPPTTIMVTEME